MCTFLLVIIYDVFTESYTCHIGFSDWVIFSAFIELINPELKTRCKLPNLALIIMFFMKIRLNLFNEAILMGYKWPVNKFPSTKALRQSVIRLSSRLTKFRKEPNSTVKDALIKSFLAEGYTAYQGI